MLSYGICNPWKDPMPTPTPNWQPLSKLPLIAQLIDGALADNQAQLRNLQQAQTLKTVLDDYTVGRVLQVFGQQKADLWLYEDQVAHWKTQSLNPAQAKEISHLEGQVVQLRAVIDEILSLAEELQQGTIEAILGKSDLELALDMLSGKLHPPL